MKRNTGIIENGLRQSALLSTSRNRKELNLSNMFTVDLWVDQAFVKQTVVGVCDEFLVFVGERGLIIVDITAGVVSGESSVFFLNKATTRIK